MAMAGSGPNFSSTSPRRSSVWGGSLTSACGSFGCGGISSKYRFARAKAFGRLEIAEHQQHGVIRRVVGVKEFLHVGERGGVEIGEIAVEIVRVGPVAKRDGRQIEPRKAAVGLVHHVDADFFLHHVALVAEIFVVHFQRAHAIGFEPQDAFQRVRRHGLEIIRDVVVRGAVEHAAGRIDQANVLHLPGVLRALEHHVLEKVREAAAAVRLEAKTNLVIDADGDEWRGTVGRRHHAQAVGERRVLDGNVKSLRR